MPGLPARSVSHQAAVAPHSRLAFSHRLHARRRAGHVPQARVAAALPVRPAAQVSPRVQVSIPSAPPASEMQNTSAPNVLGTWHGSNSRNPATLVITHRQGNEFAGTMHVRTHEASVHIAVTGHVSPKTGALTMRETQVISSSKPRAWDLGRELGHFSRSGRMSGTSTDVKGRFGAWSFSR